MLEILRKRAFGWWAGFVSRRPWLILMVSLAVAAGSVAVTWLDLEFQPDRNALISQDLSWNRLFLDWIHHFPGTYDLAVVVDIGVAAGEPGYDQAKQRATALVDELGAALKASPDVEQAVWGFDDEQSSPKTVRLLEMEGFKARLAEVGEAARLLKSPSPQALLTGAAAELRQAQTGDDADVGDEAAEQRAVVESIRTLAGFIDAVGARVADADGDGPSLRRLMEGPAGFNYLESGNGRLLFLRVTPTRDERALSSLGGSIEAVRAIIERVSAGHPEVEVGLTGIEVVESDETEAAMRDSTIASIVATVLITVLLFLAFASFRSPLLAVVALLMGVAWSFGFLTLTIGHLQVISVVFTVILLGLGIAYGIHLLSRYERVRREYPDTPEGFAAALGDVFDTMGPGIFTGAVTTAAAFVTTVFTDFAGVAEMGFIAAAGVLLCLVAMFTAFPAMLRLWRWRHVHVKPMEARAVSFFNEHWLMPFVRRPGLVLIVSAMLTAASLAAVTQMRFDFNLMNLQPAGVESVEWQRRVSHVGKESIWYGVSIVDDLQEAERLKEQFLSKQTVGAVRGIGLLFPPNEQEKLRLLARLREGELGEAVQTALRQTADGAAPAGDQPDLMNQLESLQFALGLAMLRGDVPPAVQAALQDVSAAMARTVATLKSLEPGQRARRLQRVQEEFDAWRRATAQRLETMLDPSPLQPEDFPAALIAPFIDARGDHRYALEVFPRLPNPAYPTAVDPLDPVFLHDFVSDLREVDPRATGVIMQIYNSGDLILRSYQQAGAFALLAVFVLVLIDFRSAWDALLTLVPVAAGFAVTFGLMWVLGPVGDRLGVLMQINAANIIVLPLMFGIGVDSGVHMIHRYRQDPTGRPPGMTAGTGKAITVTSLTTMIGFGAMMLATHRGIRSLGFVLTLGIGLTMLACWTVMPAWLELWRRRRDNAPSAAEQ